MRSFASEHPHEVFIGIDPGASGGLAIIGHYCGGINGADATAMPQTHRGAWDWLRTTTAAPKLLAFAAIESNTGYVGGEGNPGSAMFKFGKSHGLLEMALIAAGIPYEQITPNVWQRKLGIPPKKRDEKKSAFKNRLKARAEELFPNVKVTLATADALLIAEYCRRKRKGLL